MIRPPPRSTLFPYTTLFRSKMSPKIEKLIYHRFCIGPSINIVADKNNEIVSGDVLLFSQMGKEMRELLGAAVKDRKSTRLNSSHSSISYAVFCLKKKKNIHL